MILQALNHAYERFSRQTLVTGKPRVPLYGYSYEKISFALIIDTDGKLIDVNTVEAGELDVPSNPTVTRTSAIEPMFLWDKTAYVLGLSPEIKKRTSDEHKAFRKLQSDLAGQSDDEGLGALLRFLAAWQPSVEALPRYREEIVGTNVVFQLAGERSYLHERPAARELWLKHLRDEPASEGLCLVTGTQSRIASTHPTLGGVQGAQSSGAAIVSFNQESFRSFSKEQGANAPVSEMAAFAYTTALNELLRKDSPHKVRIGDATTVFWAEAADARDAEVAESVFAWMNDPPPPDQQDNAATAQLRQDVMERIEKGRPLENPDLHLSAGTRFYILGLAPNAARLSVRFWEATTLGALGAAFHQHWLDLRLDGLSSARPPAIWRLLSRTAPARRNQQGVVTYESKSIPPNLAGEMMRAILTGRAYPNSLQANVLMRFRTDREIDGLRVALVKACLVRTLRRSNPDLPKETYVSLNRDDPDPAYRLGRLFAILEKAQAAAMDGVNATISDRYYGAASSTPQRVFAFLVKNSKNHLATLRKGRGAKWVKNPAATGRWLDRQIGEIYDGFQNTVPASLTLEAQSRFAIGYYHEKYAKRDDAPEDLKAVAPETDEAADATLND